ncbi:hypothetical protein CcI49_28855 [Frankia sp. CcI49]|nr:hypothetical protein CcI49_28855 [Frankia sp. CcI49]
MQSESVSISQTAMDDPAEVEATSVGRPLPHREVSVQRLAWDVPGEPGEFAASRRWSSAAVRTSTPARWRKHCWDIPRSPRWRSWGCRTSCGVSRSRPSSG